MDGSIASIGGDAIIAFAGFVALSGRGKDS
jgi:hypothetical protein